MKTRMKNVILWAMLLILLTTGIGYADLSDGLMAYYPFNGNANDESGNGNHGTLMGDASTPGLLTLDGYGDYVHVPDSTSLHLSTKGTIATLFKLDSTIDVSHDKYIGIITKMRYSSSPQYIEFEMYYHPHTHVGGGLYVPLLEGFVCDNSHVDYARYTEMDPRDDTWHHLAMKWDSTVTNPYISLYLDGTLVDTRTLTGSGITTKNLPMYIGRHYHDTTGLWYYFKGMIDEVRIYNRALSESEIQQLAGTAEPTPEEQIQQILDFVDDSVIDGTLQGVGPGKSASNNLNALNNMIETAEVYLTSGQIINAYRQLLSAYGKCDGEPNPPDKVSGIARIELADKIQELLDVLKEEIEVQPLFLSGLNAAWVDFARDIGPGPTNLDAFSNIFEEVHNAGGNCVRLWLHTNGVNTPEFDSDGKVNGPGVGAISDLKNILDRASENEIGLILCLWTHNMLKDPEADEQDGLTKEVLQRNYDLLTSEDHLDAYINQALIPMVKAVEDCKDHYSVIAWEIFNEPELMTKEYRYETWWPEGEEVLMSDIQKAVNKMAGAIHRTAPGAIVTNGSRGMYSLLFGYYDDLSLILAGGDGDGCLDFYSVHWYPGDSQSPFDYPFSYWGLDKELVVAEFRANDYGQYDALYGYGYAGALAWSWTDQGTSQMLTNMMQMWDAHEEAVDLLPGFPVIPVGK